MISKLTLVIGRGLEVQPYTDMAAPLILLPYFLSFSLPTLGYNVFCYNVAFSFYYKKKNIKKTGRLNLPPHNGCIGFANPGA